MNDNVYNQLVDELKSLSREELIVKLFDLFSPSEKQYFLEIMLFKYYLKNFYK